MRPQQMHALRAGLARDYGAVRRLDRAGYADPVIDTCRFRVPV